jgi:hypothetical protein
VRPALPGRLRRVNVSGLRLGSARIDLRFERVDGAVTLADARVEGDAEVVLDPAGARGP